MEIDKASSEWLYFRRYGGWLRLNRTIRDLRRKQIKNEENAYPGFAEKLRIVALKVINDKQKYADIHTALSILSVVGTEKDIPVIENINEIGNESLSIDVKTCVYEIRRKRVDEAH